MPVVSARGMEMAQTGEVDIPPKQKAFYCSEPSWRILGFHHVIKVKEP